MHMNIVNLYLIATIAIAIPSLSTAEDHPTQLASFYTGQVERATDTQQYTFNKSAKTFAKACSLKEHSTLNVIEFHRFYNRETYDECLVRLSPSKSVSYTRWWLFNEENK